MLHQIQKTACTLAIMATATGTVLAANIDVSVIGTISPSACTPTLSGGATVDYGQIKPDTLHKDTFTLLAERTLDFAITCDAPTKVALSATSGRGASAVKDDGTLAETAFVNALFFNYSRMGVYGLGLAEGKGIGGYAIRLQADSVTADGNKVESIQAQSALAAWQTTDHGSLLSGTADRRQISWAASGTLVPLAFTTLAGKLGVQAYINKTSELNLTKAITLDGLATLELVYL